MRVSVYFVPACALLAGILTVGVSTPSDARSHPKVCAQNADPVCTLNTAGFRENFSNACAAGAAHARILHSGACFGPFCIFVPKQVCATDPATHKPATYASNCTAELGNATVLYDGPCQEKKVHHHRSHGPGPAAKPPS